MKHSLLLTSALALGIAGGCSAQTPDAQAPNAPTPPKVQQTATEIRTESLRKNNDPAGHALPLLSSWNTGANQYIVGLNPAFQIELIEKGHHIIPSFAMPNISSDAGKNGAGASEAAIEKRRAYYEAPLKRAAELQLPITLVSTQWERLLSDDKAYTDLPADKNPNVVTPEGKIENMVSPFGPVELWREVGSKWASSPLMKQVQEWYPNPPQVVMLSNNEHRKLTWKDVETDARYLAQYGKGRDDEFKRKVVADAWIERYRALQDGMRSALSKSWQDKVLFAGFNAFGPDYFGRWVNWPNHTLHTAGRIDPNPLMWDGGAPSYYTHASSVSRVQSPQVEAMNWVFMQKEAAKLNPNFRFDFSVWDGREFNGKSSEKGELKPDAYKALGQTYDPPRYSGFAQFGMWLLRPRVVREYRGADNQWKLMEPFYLALAGDVDRVYQNETLKSFWQNGELVSNRAHEHPYQVGIPAEWKNEDRWFLLDTNLDSPRPWKLNTQIPVFSLALVEGEKGNRRWLVYAHSPVEDHKNVEITIPEYGKITVDVPVAGAFYVVNEKAHSTQPVP